MKTTKQKISEYINAGYGDKKPRLTTLEVVDYANSVGAKWTVSKSEETKTTKCAGMRYTTGGGTRTYTGYRVSSHQMVNSWKGSVNTPKMGYIQIYNSAETYRTIGDLLIHLPNYRNLKN